MSAAAPKPLMTMLAPAPAILRAIASPMPLVDPVTTAVLPLRSVMNGSCSLVDEHDLHRKTAPHFSGSCFDGFGRLACRVDFVAGQVVGHHGLAVLRPLQP